MVCTMKDSNTFLNFLSFFNPHILPLARYNVVTSRHKTLRRSVSAFKLRQLSEVNDICIVPVFFSPFSPIFPAQDYIYSKYRTQLTQLNNNMHLKNQQGIKFVDAGLEILNFFFFFRFTRENVLGYFVLLLHEKMQIFGTRFRESLATVSIFDFLN